MKTTELVALTFAAIICAAPASASAVSEAATPLKEAVASFNEKVAKRFSEYDAYPGSPVAKQKRPAVPLTENEVVAAIRGWNRKEIKVDDETYRVFQRIADSKVLPPEAELSFNWQWYRFDDHDEHEFLVWWIDLSVMTGEKSGFAFRIRAERLDRRRALLPSPGYTWIVKPRDVTPRDVTPRPWTAMHAHNGVTLETRSDEKGALVVTAGWLQREDMHGWRLIAFDEKANRFILDRRISAGSGKLIMRRFRLDPAVLPANKVKHLGFEAVSGANLRRVSELAVQRAKEEEIEILPWPQVGRPYEFRLTTTEGQIIDSRKLLGKALLIDCWATWCGPCMRQIPELKDIYSKWHVKGLELVYLSFDGEVEAAKAALERHKIPWPMIHVSSEKEVRQLWREAMRVPPIPRILLIDRQGVLRFDTSSSAGIEKTLDERIGALLEGPSAATDDP